MDNHRWRCHQSLQMDCPVPRTVQPPDMGEVVKVAEAGGKSPRPAVSTTISSVARLESEVLACENWETPSEGCRLSYPGLRSRVQLLPAQPEAGRASNIGRSDGCTNACLLDRRAGNGLVYAITSALHCMP